MYRYKIVTVDMEFICIITINSKTSQAVVNELVTQGYNPLLCCWQLLWDC